MQQGVPSVRNKIVVVSQHYPPDQSTTAAIMAEIAKNLAKTEPVIVLSGTPGSRADGGTQLNTMVVEEIKNRIPAKAALGRRGASELMFALRTFFRLLSTLHRGDIALTVPAPFVLPYVLVAAAKLKGARSVVIMHDLFPDVLVVAGLLTPTSLLTKSIHAANAWMLHALSALVVIGRDSGRILLRYGEELTDKISFIPNWATLDSGVRPKTSDNPYRRKCEAEFVVGLSGNLGFTHDPLVVFEAAKLLANESRIHFLLSGWGVGFDQLRMKQSEARLPNVTVIERVVEHELETLLSAADVWIIPYRAHVAGVSIPSRFYNILAVGRPVVLVSEPDSEAALIIKENNLGWVSEPGMPDQLADVLRLASISRDTSMSERGAEVARKYSLERAMRDYRVLIDRLLRNEKERRPAA
jgi:colanic acid biosynthesis glycosyl transferase WcaI